MKFIKYACLKSGRIFLWVRKNREKCPEDGTFFALGCANAPRENGGVGKMMDFLKGLFFYWGHLSIVFSGGTGKIKIPLFK